MKGSFKYKNKRGLPGGPNEQFTYVTGVFSTEGYKRNSPDVNNPFNIIPSGNITMKGVDFPVLGVDNLGNSKIMQPGKDYQFPGNTVFELPMLQRGGNFNIPVSSRDSVQNIAGNIIDYEILRGGSGGTPLPFYGQPQYMSMLMNDIYPEVKKIMPNASAIEIGEAMDFIFNAGWDKKNKKIKRDPRAYALQEYYKKYDPSKLNKDGKWAGRKGAPYSFDDEYNRTIGKLSENERRIFMNKGRDWYYQNTAPAGSTWDLKTQGPHPNYKDTWYGRIWNTNEYAPFNPNNPKFIPKKQRGGEPIYVTDKNDPRYKSYQDSLQAFNFAKNYRDTYNLDNNRAHINLRRLTNEEEDYLYPYLSELPVSSGTKFTYEIRKPAKPVIYKPWIKPPDINLEGLIKRNIKTLDTPPETMNIRQTPSRQYKEEDGKYYMRMPRSKSPNSLQWRPITKRTYDLKPQYQIGGEKSYLDRMNQVIQSDVLAFPQEAALPRANRLKREAAERAAAQWQNDQNLRRQLNTQQGMSDNTIVSPEYLQSTRSKEKVIQRPELGQIRMPSTSIQSGLAPGFSGVMPNWVNDRTGYGNQMGFNLFMTEPFLGAVGERWLSPVLNRALTPVAKATGKALAPVGNYLTTKTPLKNAWKFNPYAPELGQYNRVVGQDAIYDMLETGLVRVSDQAGTTRTLGPFGTIKRKTPYPSFGNAKPVQTYIDQVVSEGKTPYVISTNRPMGVSTLGRHGKGSTRFPIDKAGKYIKAFPASEAQVYEAIPHWWQGYKPANMPKQLPGSSSVLSSASNAGIGTVTKSQSWQMQDLPGLHLKSTMEGGPLSKIVEPKTGLINTEQALAIIGKESGGADKVSLIRQGLGNNIPKKMDYNEFRKVVQDQLIPLERQFATHSSNYGINRLGYPRPKRSSFERAMQNNKEQIERLENAIALNPRTTNKDLIALERDQFALQESKKQLNNSLKEADNLPLENQTLILGNKNKFGRGSLAHGNPEETLGHIHFLRDAETPDILTVTQIQSDAFQGTHRVSMKTKEQAKFNYDRQLEYYNKNKDKIEGIKKIDENTYQFPDGQKISKSVYENMFSGLDESLALSKADLENFTQKQLLDKNHQERYLQELVDYAGKRGDINKVRLPTSETAAKVQGYSKVEPVTDPDEIAKIKRQIEAGKKRAAEAPTKDKEKWERGVKSLQLELNGGYEFQHQTILKKYSQQPKTIKKLFGKEPTIVTDSKGNTWYEFDIPNNFKQGRGEIKAFSRGGSLPQYQTGGEPKDSSYLSNMRGILGSTVFPQEAALQRINREKREAEKRAAAQWQYTQDLRNELNNQQSISDNTAVSPEYLQRTQYTPPTKSGLQGQTYISEYEAPSLAQQTRNRLANPLTTFGYMVRGERIPDRVPSKGNPYDMALDAVNPFAWLDYAIASGESLAEGDVLGAGLNALGAIPTVPVGGRYAKTIDRYIPGNPLRTNYNKVATGNSPLPIAWRVEKVKSPIKSTDYITKKYTNAEAQLFNKYGEGMTGLTPNDWKNFEKLVKSGSTDFSKKNIPITRVLDYYASATPETEAIKKLGLFQSFKTPTEKTIRTWSAGYPKDWLPAQTSSFGPKTRLVIPSRYTKNLGNSFTGMPYNDKRVGFIWRNVNGGTSRFPRLNTTAVTEKELMGNIPKGFRVIGKSKDDGFNNLIIKPVNRFGMKEGGEYLRNMMKLIEDN